MSYVLEALRRAEAERQRGNVPGLHAQTLPAPEAVAADEGPGRRPWWRSAAGAAVAIAVVLAAGVWLWLPGPSGHPEVQARQAAKPSEAAVEQAAEQAARESPVLTVVPRPAPPPVARTPARPAGQTSGEAGASPSERVLPFASLPDALRRQIPAMAFGGSTYSPEPTARMLIINGQIWREGEQPSAELTLERIELRSAQFRFRDQRFEVSY